MRFWLLMTMMLFSKGRTSVHPQIGNIWSIFSLSKQLMIWMLSQLTPMSRYLLRWQSESKFYLNLPSYASPFLRISPSSVFVCRTYSFCRCTSSLFRIIYSLFSLDWVVPLMFTSWLHFHNLSSVTVVYNLTSYCVFMMAVWERWLMTSSRLVKSLSNGFSLLHRQLLRISYNYCLVPWVYFYPRSYSNCCQYILPTCFSSSLYSFILDKCYYAASKLASSVSQRLFTFALIRFVNVMSSYFWADRSLFLDSKGWYALRMRARRGIGHQNSDYSLASRMRGCFMMFFRLCRYSYFSISYMDILLFDARSPSWKQDWQSKVPSQKYSYSL